MYANKFHPERKCSWLAFGGHFQLIFGFIFRSFLIVWLKNDQNGPKKEIKNDVKNGYCEHSEMQMVGK